MTAVLLIILIVMVLHLKKLNKAVIHIARTSADISKSLEDASKVFGEDAGLLIYNNLVISERQPTMNTSTVWGRIDEVLG